MASILIVDDNPANLLAMEATLESLGQRVVRADSGERALKLILEQDFACILMDVHMPGLDGFETAELIKLRERSRHMPVLFLTAVSREEADIVRGYSAGAVDYLLKPYDPGILRSKVRVFIELYHREQRVLAREAQLHRHQVERARIETEAERQKLRDIFMQAPVAICILEGAEHTFMFANPSYLALVGNRNVVGKPLLEALPELAGQGFDTLLDQVVARGEPFIGKEISVKLAHHADGEVDYMNFVYQPKRNGQGQVDGVLVCAFEVTDQVLARQRAEAAVEGLRAADERFRLAIRSSGIIVYGQDLALRHVWIENPLPGFAPDAVVGKTDREIHPPENAARLDALKRRALSGESVREVIPLLFGQETRFFQVMAEPHQDDAGAIDGLIGATLDVTDQVRAREQAEAMTARLLESEEQFHTLADSIPQLAWIAGRSGDIDWYNRRWYEYTGTSFEQMAGWGWQAVQHPEELPRVMAHFKASIASGEVWEDTFALRRADGEYRWFLSRAMPVRDSAGRIVRWFGTNTDVHEHRKQAAALEDAVKARDDFLSIAGHELKTPLAALLLHVQSLQRARQEVATEIKLTERLEKASGAGLRLESLIDQMLDVSRIAAGRLRLEPERFAMAELIGEVVDRFAEQAARAGTRISVRADREVLGTWDRLHTDQVLTNLIGNALKYGQGKPIDVELAATAGHAAIRVTDRGIGIDSSQQQKIFERFERAVGTREFGGLGLGLWISRQIVEASGGRIEVESEPGKGATFTVRLPLQMQEQARVGR